MSSPCSGSKNKPSKNQREAGSKQSSSTLQMEATCSSETSDDFERTTRCYIPEDRTLDFEEFPKFWGSTKCMKLPQLCPLQSCQIWLRLVQRCINAQRTDTCTPYRYKRFPFFHHYIILQLLYVYSYLFPL
jgi:hypothetical protein